MKDGHEEMDVVRPTVDAMTAIQFCLSKLYEDDKHRRLDEIADGLTYEEVIGALLLARDELDGHSRPHVHEGMNTRSHFKPLDGSAPNGWTRALEDLHGQNRPYSKQRLKRLARRLGEGQDAKADTPTVAPQYTLERLAHYERIAAEALERSSKPLPPNVRSVPKGTFLERYLRKCGKPDKAEEE